MTPGEGLAGDGGGGALRMGDNKLTSDSQQLKGGRVGGMERETIGSCCLIRTAIVRHNNGHQLQ